MVDQSFNWVKARHECSVVRDGRRDATALPVSRPATW